MLLYRFTLGVNYGFPWVVILFVYIVIIGILYFHEMLNFCDAFQAWYARSSTNCVH